VEFASGRGGRELCVDGKRLVEFVSALSTILSLLSKFPIGLAVDVANRGLVAARGVAETERLEVVPVAWAVEVVTAGADTTVADRGCLGPIRAVAVAATAKVPAMVAVVGAGIPGALAGSLMGADSLIGASSLTGLGAGSLIGDGSLMGVPGGNS
jgi:hypothetical protein